MRQVIKHREIRLLKMTRRTDPVIPGYLGYLIQSHFTFHSNLII